MRTISTTALALTCALLTVAPVRAAEIRVVTSGAFTAAYLELVPQYERATHNELLTGFGPSMGTSYNAIPMRLKRGEAIDLVILAAPALDDLIRQGKVRADSRVDLVRSSIGMAVKAGAPKPDISTIEALKRTLLAAKSIAYSDSASGVYLATELFPKLGIADQIKGKTRKIEDQEDRGRPRWRSGGEGRGGDRLPADQRTASGKGYQHRGRVAARGAESHGVCRRHPRNGEGSGGGQGSPPVACLTSRLACHQEEWFGTGEIS
jgi:hypothetical protein